MRIAALAITVALAMGNAPARSEAPQPTRNVVVLQDAAIDGSEWEAVDPLLHAAGLEIVAAVAAQVSVEDTAAAARRVLASLKGPVVLVAHGWSGAVASEIGADPKVSALVFIAATAPEAGEDLAALAARVPSVAEAARRAEAMVPRIEGKTHAAPWREKPSFYAVLQQHQVFAAALQRFYAARMKAKTIVLDSEAMLPRETAGLILEAAGRKPVACGAAGDDGKAACAAPALPRSLAEGCKCEKGSLEDLTAP